MIEHAERRAANRLASLPYMSRRWGSRAREFSVWSPRRILLYALALCLMTLVPYAVAITADVARGQFPVGESGAPIGGDLPSHLLGGRLLLQGDLHRLYDLEYQRQFWQEWLPGADFNPYVSPPFMAAFYAPLAAMPYGLALTIWSAFTIALIVVALCLLWPLIPNLHQFGRRTILGHLFVAPPALYVLLGGQDSALSLCLLAGGLRLLLAGRSVAAGALLGLGVFKPQLIAVVPILLLAQRRWRALGAWTAVAGTLTAVSMAMVGWEGVHDYAALPGSDFYRQAVVEGKGWEMQSVVAMARIALPPVFDVAVTPLAVAIGLVAFWFLIRAGASVRLQPEALPWAFGVALLAVPLMSPHLFIYDCLVLAIPVLVLLNAGLQPRAVRSALLIAYLCLWTTPYRFFAVEDAKWPTTVLAAPWGLLAFVVLFALMCREMLGAAPSQSSSSWLATRHHIVSSINRDNCSRDLAECAIYDQNNDSRASVCKAIRHYNGLVAKKSDHRGKRA